MQPKMAGPPQKPLTLSPPAAEAFLALQQRGRVRTRENLPRLAMV